MSCRVHAASCTPRPRPRHATPTEVRKRKREIEARDIHSLNQGQVYMTSPRRPLLFEDSRPSPPPLCNLGPSVAVSTRRTQRSWVWRDPYLLHPFSHGQFTHPPHGAPLPSRPFYCEQEWSIFFGGGGGWSQERVAQRDVRFCLA